MIPTEDTALQQAFAPVLAYAEAEARDLKHIYIGTEHLLLGMLREESSVASEVLRTHFKIGYAQVRSALLFICGEGTDTHTPIPLTPRSRLLLRLAAEEATRLNHQQVAASHIFLAICQHQEGIAAGILESLGVTNLRNAYTLALEAMTRNDEPLALPDMTKALLDVESLNLWKTREGCWLAEIKTADQDRTLFRQPTLADLLTQLYHATCEQKGEQP